LLEKRYALKKLLSQLSKLDCRYKAFKARTAAHKWLLVTCFGYLGYKNARFGKIEAHEAVTAYGREVLLRAKEAAEDMGFRVLHLYVDGMWVQQAGHKTAKDFQPLMEEIQKRTLLPIALDGIYKWVAFLPSRQNKKIAVPNRYFGVFQDGEIKTRGIETRRHDTPEFIRETQMQILEILGKAPEASELVNCLPEIRRLVHRQQTALREGRVPVEKLIVRQTVSRRLEEFRAPSPVAVALAQLQDAGKELRPGQPVRLVYTRGEPRVRAWDLPEALDVRTVNVHRYQRLLWRAVDTVVEPVTGLDIAWLTQARQLSFLFASLHG
jgi:DNA polymerase-2